MFHVKHPPFDSFNTHQEGPWDFATLSVLRTWMTLTSILGLIIIFFFQGQVATMLRFAMIGSFLTTPFFALLNYVLVTKEKKDLPTWLKGLAIAGLIFLFGFALFFIWALAIGKAG